MSELALEIDDIDVRYGHVEALGGVSLDLFKGETHALLGPNGAGKSTLLKAISGLLPPSRGEITYNGKNIDGIRADRVTRAGIVHVPEGRQVIVPLSVQENLLVARSGAGRRIRMSVDTGLDMVFEAFPMLAEFRNKPAGVLSGGQQQMLAFGRAIMAEPDVLLLDEPSMGLAPVITERVYEFLELKEKYFGECTILLAEQSQVALGICDRVTVITKGQVVQTVPVDEMDKDVALAAYFGSQQTDERKH